MKKGMLAVICFLISAQVMAQRSIQSLVGRWEDVRAASECVGLDVGASTAIHMVYCIEKKKIVSYKADFSVTPVRFDFVIKDSTETITLKSLLDFVNDDLIKWQLFEGDAKPIYFANDSGEIMYLRRKK